MYQRFEVNEVPQDRFGKARACRRVQEGYLKLKFGSMLTIDMLSMPAFLCIAKTSTTHPPFTLKYQWRLGINACLKVWDQVVPGIHRERMQADGLLIQEEAVVVQITLPWSQPENFLSKKKKRGNFKKQK